MSRCGELVYKHLYGVWRTSFVYASVATTATKMNVFSIVCPINEIRFFPNVSCPAFVPFHRLWLLVPRYRRPLRVRHLQLWCPRPERYGGMTRRPIDDNVTTSNCTISSFQTVSSNRNPDNTVRPNRLGLIMFSKELKNCSIRS